MSRPSGIRRPSRHASPRFQPLSLAINSNASARPTRNGAITPCSRRASGCRSRRVTSFRRGARAGGWASSKAVPGGGIGGKLTPTPGGRTKFAGRGGGASISGWSVLGAFGPRTLRGCVVGQVRLGRQMPAGGNRLLSPPGVLASVKRTAAGKRLLLGRAQPQPRVVGLGPPAGAFDIRASPISPGTGGADIDIVATLRTWRASSPWRQIIHRREGHDPPPRSGRRPMVLASRTTRLTAAGT